MNDNGEDFVPSFDNGEDQPQPSPAEPSSAQADPEPGTGALPPQRREPLEPTKEHQPTSALPLAESMPPAPRYVIEPPPPPRRKAQNVPTILVVLVLGAVCLVSMGLIVISGALNSMIPADVLQIADFLTPAGSRGNASPSPTVTRTPLGSVPTSTPAVAVTVLASPIPGETLAATLTLTPTKGPTAKPANVVPPAPPVPTAIPTLAAPTLTPESYQAGQAFSQGGVPMLYIPGGTFNMGSDASGIEKPVHAVALSPFYIDKFEVTNSAWSQCVAAGACAAPGSTDGYDGKPYYGVEASNNSPVIFVSWYNADSYCRWRGGTLPTEAQWEMAARWNPGSGSGTIYPWGDEWNPANLNYCDSTCLNNDTRFKDTAYSDNFPQMAPVGSFAPDVSPLGLVDMGGNVAEWVADWYGSDYYSASSAENPTGPGTGFEKVIRGGGWSLNQLWSRSTARNHFGPLTQAAGVGFRCARNP